MERAAPRSGARCVLQIIVVSKMSLVTSLLTTCEICE
ncbi:unnamed protein product [Staurois parvus]|uniref:Uncharacterized protein n=1 Tax=Staurois parvus TaxID=386267 RepID=A0ABN9BIE8_9NEOB|nr:unnamed protein product [Staurois parvus]